PARDNAGLDQPVAPAPGAKFQVTYRPNVVRFSSCIYDECRRLAWRPPGAGALEEILDEAEALAERAHRDVAPVFAGVLSQRGGEVVGDQRRERRTRRRPPGAGTRSGRAGGRAGAAAGPAAGPGRRRCAPGPRARPAPGPKRASRARRSRRRAPLARPG